MNGIVLHCPSCKKLLLKEASLPYGTNFKVKCFWCGSLVDIQSKENKIGLRNLTAVEKQSILIVEL